MFSNRDTYDLVIVVDQESTSIAASSPLSSLFRAIYEFEFKKNLKRPPLLLVGGMAAWRHDMGMELIEGRRQETRDDADLSLRNPSVVDTSSTEQTSYVTILLRLAGNLITRLGCCLWTLVRLCLCYPDPIFQKLRIYRRTPNRSVGSARSISR